MNAKKELLEHIKERTVTYVQVVREISYAERQTLQGTLSEVLPLLDFDYDNGFGSQELTGTIWYADGTWSERDELDGSEWWSHRVRPAWPNGTREEWTLDFDGPVLSFSSRFYPPKTHSGDKWDGSLTVNVMGREIMQKWFECETLEDLRSAVKAFTEELVAVIACFFVSADRERWVKVEIVGETSRSWVTNYFGRKVPKKGGYNYAFCEADIDRMAFVEQRWQIGEAVKRCVDYETLKRIADAVGYSG